MLSVVGGMGGPSNVVRVLREFYQRQERWVEYRGAVDPQPIKPVRSIVQGCPASALMLAGIMTVWVEYVKRREPDVRMGVFLDDRTVWARDSGEGVENIIRRVLNKGAGVDKAFGLQEHPDKRSLFANKGKTIEKMRDMVQGKGCVGKNFVMLGVHYECTARRIKIVKEKSCVCV